MELSELTAYAKEKYHIREQQKWMNLPGWSVLANPRTDKWIALLMRQWDTDTGMFIERCDIKCGRRSLAEFPRPYLSRPIHMEGNKWIGAAFDERTEPEVIFQLFDRAMTSDEQHGYTIVLDPVPSAEESSKDQNTFLHQSGRTDHDTPLLFTGGTYHDTPLPFTGGTCHDTPLPFTGGRPPKDPIPEQLRQMKHLYEYSWDSRETKARNFYRQGMFMKDYEDNVPWSGPFVCFFPTYHDMTTRQLRGYFTWRTQIRKGEYHPIADSAAYIYLYELLNGIGSDTPEESLQKMKAFERGYIESGFGDRHMAKNLKRWMLEFCVLHDLPREMAEQCADPQMILEDTARAVLRNPDNYSDEEVFSSLCRFARKSFPQTPVVTGDESRGRHLFAETWRGAASGYRERKKGLFTLCFGRRTSRPWFPLANTVCYMRGGTQTRDYVLNECRIFHCRGGIWEAEAYESLSFDRDRFQGFLREADLMLRRYLKTGRYLQEKPEDSWAAPFIGAVIEADRQAMAEVSRPEVSIDLSGLDRIRREAQITQESLLAEDDMPDPEDKTGSAGSTDTAGPTGSVIGTGSGCADLLSPEGQISSVPSSVPLSEPASGVSPDLPLDEIHVRILRMLLRGESVSGIITENRLMPDIVADTINDALFDEVGDTVLSCEDDVLSIVEDYREDLIDILG